MQGTLEKSYNTRMLQVDEKEFEITRKFKYLE
jgi:hypothetical protein